MRKIEKIPVDNESVSGWFAFISVNEKSREKLCLKRH